MQKQATILAACALIVLAALHPITAQTPSKTLSSQEMLAVFALQFDLTLPDTTFIEMEAGTVWEEAGTEAKIMCNAMPASYERVLQDTNDIASSPEMVLLKKGRLDLNGVPGYLIQMEFLQPEGSGSSGSFEGLMYIRPLDAQTALTVNVAYPKSQHNRLYQKMLAAFSSVRQRMVSKGQ